MNAPPSPLAQPQSLIGTWRRFGLVGPVYEIIAQAGTAPDGDLLMRVRVVESGEEIDCPLAQILEDPREG